jgi:ubiquinone/menaquinone biosynthesis C-methylase UbiE
MSEATNDALARKHPGDAYYRDAAWPIRFVESRRLVIIRRMVGNAAGLSMLEVGCGAGYVLREFPDAKLTGVDISRVALDAAESNLAGYDVELLHANADGLTGSYDRIICSEVLEHVDDPDSMLATIARLLTPRGRAVITIPHDQVIRAVKVPMRPFMRVDWGGDEFHANQWTPDEFTAQLERHMRIVQRSFAPFRLLPIRACFLCERRA